LPPDEIFTLRLPASPDDALWATLRAAGRDLSGAVRLVVLRGEGADFYDGTSSQASAGSTAGGPAVVDHALRWMRRPDLITVAAITGRATGAGLDVAMACDLRVVADDAELAPSTHDPERGAGVTVETVARIGDLLGYPRALEFLTAGRSLSGAQAGTLGLANLAVDRTKFDAAVEELAAKVLGTPRTTATMAKAVLAASEAGRRHQVDELTAGLRLMGES
jgi:enoyl-CoA hydratase/carnithine racemase